MSEREIPNTGWEKSAKDYIASSLGALGQGTLVGGTLGGISYVGSRALGSEHANTFGKDVALLSGALCGGLILSGMRKGMQRHMRGKVKKGKLLLIPSRV